MGDAVKDIYKTNSHGISAATVHELNEIFSKQLPV